MRRPRPLRSVSPRIPVPTSVRIYNSFQYRTGNPSEEEELRSKKWCYQKRLDPSIALIRPLRLDMVVSTGSESLVKGEEDSDKTERKKELILYSRRLDSGTLLPAWHNLHEYIDADTISADQYESIEIRIYVLPYVGLSEGKMASSALESNQESNKRQVKEVLWQKVAAYPSKLARLGQAPDPRINALPLNFIVVEYTDKSMRVRPSHSLLLSECKVTWAGWKGDKDASSTLIPREGLDGDLWRFKDTVFRTLDQVDACTEPGVQNLAPAHGNVESMHTDSVANFSRRIELAQIDQVILKEAIQREEALLEEEMNATRTTLVSFQKLEEECKVTEQATKQTRDAILQERIRTRKVHISIAVQRFRLFAQLRSVFPISVHHPENTNAMNQDDVSYKVRGLPVPRFRSEALLQMEDDALSSSLGCLCHLVQLLSKYRAIQLRYRLICHLPGVQDDRAIVYPLFLQGRTTSDREQLELGIRLLSKNVDCLMTGLKTQLNPDTHILERLQHIFNSCLED